MDSLNLRKYTKEAQEVVRWARLLAEYFHHEQIEPIHLLAVLTMQPRVWTVQSGTYNELRALRESVNEELRRVPRVRQGKRAYPSNQFKDVVTSAQSIARSKKRNYVTTEDLLWALVYDEISGTGKLLRQVGFTPDKILRGLWPLAKRDELLPSEASPPSEALPRNALPHGPLSWPLTLILLLSTTLLFFSFVGFSLYFIDEAPPTPTPTPILAGTQYIDRKAELSYHPQEGIATPVFVRFELQEPSYVPGGVPGASVQQGTVPLPVDPIATPYVVVELEPVGLLVTPGPEPAEQALDPQVNRWTWWVIAPDAQTYPLHPLITVRYRDGDGQTVGTSVVIPWPSKYATIQGVSAGTQLAGGFFLGLGIVLVGLAGTGWSVRSLVLGKKGPSQVGQQGPFKRHPPKLNPTDPPKETDPLKELVELLSSTSAFDTFAQRTTLLAGIPNKLDRDEDNKYEDLLLIVNQLDKRGQMQDGNWPILKLIDNAMPRFQGYELGDKLQSLRATIAQAYLA